MSGSDSATRRRFLTVCGGGATAVLSGCTATTDEPSYRGGQVNETGGEARTAEQMLAAEALAITEANENTSPLDSLALETHEFVVADGYKGPTVRGTVSNTGSESMEVAEVRVRVYDAAGAQLGRYLDRTGDIDGGEAWKFEAIILDSVADIERYDVAVLGIPE